MERCERKGAAHLNQVKFWRQLSLVQQLQDKGTVLGDKLRAAARRRRNFRGEVPNKRRQVEDAAGLYGMRCRHVVQRHGQAGGKDSMDIE